MCTGSDMFPEGSEACGGSVREACGGSVREACGGSVREACAGSVREACSGSVREACAGSVRELPVTLRKWTRTNTALKSCTIRGVDGKYSRLVISASPTEYESQH